MGLIYSMNKLSDLDQRQGLIHLYEGDGKGKTTAAAGLAARAAGHGQRVLFCQFLKNAPTGEVVSLEALGIRVMRPQSSPKFFFQMNPHEAEAATRQNRACLEEAVAACRGDAVDLLVLDEILDAVNCGLFREDEVADFLERKPSRLEVVLTGRGPGKRLRGMADYHTAFSCVRHPYQKGVAGRRGVEY